MVHEIMDISKNSEDSQVDSLIKELNYLIKSCDKKDEINKVRQIANKKVRNVCSKENYSEKQNLPSTFSSRNKRKIETPTKRSAGKDEENKETLNSSRYDEISFSPNEMDDTLEESTLTIDESRTKKRKSNVIRDADIPHELMELMVKSGIDDKLENVAMKEKLTGTHVKNIIKEVINDKSVLMMLRSGICGMDNDMDFLADYEPTLTRARKKELFEKQAKEDENLTPNAGLCSSATSSFAAPETRSLGTTEFPDDDDDDEYQPELDEEKFMSDEESFASSSFGSPSTFSRLSFTSHSDSASKTPSVRFAHSPLTPMRKDDENPRRELAMKNLKFNGDESLISKRTRSKCPLTDTTVEHLEMAFQPPDITSDMYETSVDDEDWKKFLLDLAHPQDATKVPEDDEHVDPEYNLIADAEEEEGNISLDEIKEELRFNKAAKISKKEVDQLLQEVQPEDSDDDEVDECEGETSIVSHMKKETSIATDRSMVSDAGSGICATNDAGRVVTGAIFDVQNHVVDISGFSRNWTEDSVITDYNYNNEPFNSRFYEIIKDHIDVIEDQLAQHVQLLTQSILMSCYEEKFSTIEIGCKNMLNEMHYVGLNMGSHEVRLKAFNLEAALNTIQHYDLKREKCITVKKRKMEQSLENCGFRNYDRKYIGSFPPIIQRIFLLSCAFPFANLLPKGVFPSCDDRGRKGFTHGEYCLLALSFKEAVPDISIFNTESRNKGAKYYDSNLAEICNRVAKNSCVLATGKYLGDHFRRLLKQNMFKGLHEDNPLIKFTKNGIVELPQSNPQDKLKRSLCPLKDLDPQTLPPHFQKFVERFKKSEKVTVVPCISETSKGQNIIIIENPAEMKVILPPTSILVAQYEENS